MIVLSTLFLFILSTVSNSFEPSSFKSNQKLSTQLTFTHPTIGQFWTAGRLSVSLSIPASMQPWTQKGIPVLRPYCTIEMGPQFLQSDTFHKLNDGTWRPPSPMIISLPSFSDYETIQINCFEKVVFSPKPIFLGNIEVTAAWKNMIDSQTPVEHMVPLMREWMVSPMPQNNLIKVVLSYNHDSEKVHPTPAKDFTQQFQMLMKNPSERTEKFISEHPFAKDIHFLLVPGFVTGLYPNYFMKNLNQLEAMGLSASICGGRKKVFSHHYLKDYKTFSPSDQNAATIAWEIKTIYESTGKNIVLIGHSKGGNDIYNFLTQKPGFAKLLVRGIVILQSPIYGTPVEFLLKEAHLSRFVGDAFGVVGLARDEVLESFKTFSQTSYSHQKNFTFHNPYPEHIPTVSIASFVDSLFETRLTHSDILESPGWFDSFVGESVETMMEGFSTASEKLLGWNTDGLCMPYDSIVPNSRYAIFHGDHSIGAMDHSPLAGPITQVALEILFDYIEKENPGGFVRNDLM